MVRQNIGCVTDHFAPLKNSRLSLLQCLFYMMEPLQPSLNNCNQFLAFRRSKNPFDDENCKLELFWFKLFHTNLSMANWPPPCVQQQHLCSAFSSSRSLCSTSKIFLIDSSRFKDQKTLLRMEILSRKYFGLIFSYESVHGKLATTLCSTVSPLQCLFDIKEPLQRFQNIFNRFFMFPR